MLEEGEGSIQGALGGDLGEDAADKRAHDKGDANEGGGVGDVGGDFLHGDGIGDVGLTECLRASENAGVGAGDEEDPEVGSEGLEQRT